MCLRVEGGRLAIFTNVGEKKLAPRLISPDRAGFLTPADGISRKFLEPGCISLGKRISRPLPLTSRIGTKSLSNNRIGWGIDGCEGARGIRTFPPRRARGGSAPTTAGNEILASGRRAGHRIHRGDDPGCRGGTEYGTKLAALTAWSRHRHHPMKQAVGSGRQVQRSGGIAGGHVREQLERATGDVGRRSDAVAHSFLFSFRMMVDPPSARPTRATSLR